MGSGRRRGCWQLAEAVRASAARSGIRSIAHHDSTNCLGAAPAEWTARVSQEPGGWEEAAEDRGSPPDEGGVGGTATRGRPRLALGSRGAARWKGWAAAAAAAAVAAATSGRGGRSAEVANQFDTGAGGALAGRRPSEWGALR